jgi:2,3-dihydroxybiphenyl 1,2-dioxygenase
MDVRGLGYVGVRAKDVDEWAGFGTRLLGMQIVDKSRSSVALRMDDRKQRVIVSGDGGEGAGFYGWEVDDSATLDRVAARLEAAGVAVARGARSLADERFVKDVIVLNDPIGNRVEIFHGPHVASEPFRAGRTISGFRTGPLGMGHMVLTVARLDDVVPFYCDLLGFRLSDYILRPFRISFFHTNPRHHSIGFIENGRNGVHHMMVELFSLDDVGQGYDIAQTEEGRVMTTLGRHINDMVTSFYARTPSGFMLEYGWGGRVIESDKWQPGEVTYGPSMWGHDRMWLTADEREEARQLRMRAAADGLRNPVQVVDGNYNLMPGMCPWFDEMKGRRADGRR